MAPLARRLVRSARLGVPLLLGWLALGWLLSRLATRVADWYVMTDELLYERLALSIVHFHSPLPRVHGVLVPSVNQLYPLLLAAVYRGSEVPGALRDAHLLNAFLMSSAAIPAYLLARRATGSRAVAALVALGTVCVPWIVYSSFLLTEVVGYPAFLWAVLAIQKATVAPSRRNGLLALLGLALAVLAREQFLVLVVVLPVVVLAYELSTAPTAGGWRGLGAALRRTLARQRTLAVAYALLGVAALVLLALGRASTILGTYADTAAGNVLPAATAEALLTHLAVLALSVAILPFLIALGYLLASVARPEAGERSAFTLSALATIVAVLVEVTVFDVRFGGGVVRDRYFFYVVPLVLIACACGLRARWRRAWLIAPAVLVAAGFLFAGLPSYGTLDADTPVSDIDGYLRTSVHSLEGARLTLAAASLLLGALYLRASSLLPRRALGVLVALMLALALPAETWYAYATLFRYPGTAGRPLTRSEGAVFDWVDQTIGTSPQVTMLPYPSKPGDYQASRAYWWDLEFWNESVGAAADFPGEFEGTPSTFPTLALRFDPRTGVANISPTRYAVELGSESRFRLAGNVTLFDRGAYLIDTGGLWRADWLTLGLYDDGWTVPGVVARVRVFSAPGQAGPQPRTLELELETRAARSSAELVSNQSVWRGPVHATGVSTVAVVPLCLPARGFTDVTLVVRGQTPVYGDMRNINTFGSYRTAGALVSRVALYDGSGRTCTPAR